MVAAPMCSWDVVSFRSGGIGGAGVVLCWGRSTYYDRMNCEKSLNSFSQQRLILHYIKMNTSLRIHYHCIVLIIIIIIIIFVINREGNFSCCGSFC